VEQGPAPASDVESVSFISPLTLAMFVGSLGFLGLVFRSGMAVSPEQSIFLAAPSALLVTAILFYVFVKVFVSSESTSLTRVQDCVGVEAEVVARIEAGRVGSIAYVDKGARITLPARSDGDDAFNRGDRVYIARFEGNTAYVQSSRGNLWGA
jgi:membrane protein implicated in regulation of membrane protease activity